MNSGKKTTRLTLSELEGKPGSTRLMDYAGGFAQNSRDKPRVFTEMAMAGLVVKEAGLLDLFLFLANENAVKGRAASRDDVVRLLRSLSDEVAEPEMVSPSVPRQVEARAPQTASPAQVPAPPSIAEDVRLPAAGTTLDSAELEREADPIQAQHEDQAVPPETVKQFKPLAGFSVTMG
ncbi:hypothetical protein [Marinobacterium jannaschii]|uniref:hypothetical protein n=1 Tax=Marinobacterium jannaschii TaxID=64970 RepID=UPI00048208CE|nr:hypothetical protein [Marinobacterium jannaschii]